MSTSAAVAPLSPVRTRVSCAVERVRLLGCDADGHARLRVVACLALEALSTALFAAQGSVLAEPLAAVVAADVERIEAALAGTGVAP